MINDVFNRSQDQIRAVIEALQTAIRLLTRSQLNTSQAVERIRAAIRGQEMICVWGDFDVDGQSSTTVLVQTLQALGANVVYYIPIRGKESHGIHIETLQPIIDNGTRLIVTCDTGITAYEAIDYANSCGVDVIVTDHHELGPRLPNARAILNPKLF